MIGSPINSKYLEGVALPWSQYQVRSRAALQLLQRRQPITQDFHTVDELVNIVAEQLQMGQWVIIPSFPTTSTQLNVEMCENTSHDVG
jgi:hypothetical protein